MNSEKNKSSKFFLIWIGSIDMMKTKKSCGVVSFTRSGGGGGGELCALYYTVYTVNSDSVSLARAAAADFILQDSCENFVKKSTKRYQK